MDTKSISKVDPSSKSIGSPFEKTETDNDMEKCVSLMDHLHVPIVQNDNRKPSSDLVGPYADQGFQKNPFAKVPSPGRRRGGIYIPGEDFIAFARSINSNPDTSHDESNSLYHPSTDGGSPSMKTPNFKPGVIFLLDHLNNLGGQEPIRQSPKPQLGH